MKLHNYKLAASLYGVMLLILLVLLYRVDTVCKQQVDTLDQIMELRQELDASSGTNIEQARKALLCAGCGREDYAGTVRT